ncbi:hypothetical protein [Planctomycetes bacterium Pan216]
MTTIKLPNSELEIEIATEKYGVTLTVEFPDELVRRIVDKRGPVVILSQLTPEESLRFSNVICDHAYAAMGAMLDRGLELLADPTE